MDRTDCEILKCLSENARSTASSVATRVNLSVSAVTERIHRMEERGVIRGYALLLDPKAIGQETQAYLEVTLEGSEYGEGFCHAACAMEPILRCDYFAGEFDVLLLAQAPDVETISKLHTALKRIPGVKQIRIRFILRTEKNVTTALPVSHNENS
ncbi:MAG: Lrp/AsnC family transcriptional regulator [Clostridia bacterium]|nr:Lrp/AsnC family transcriptional regulator [Clostridia bacterium]